ncbi:MAG: ABC transporter ATP-binding protein [Candidatus Falkowbacteria bacterium]
MSDKNTEKKDDYKLDSSKLKQFLPQLFDLIKPSLPSVKMVIFLAVVSEALNMVGPYIFKLVIDRLINFKSQDFLLLALMAAAFLLAEQSNNFVSWLSNRKIWKLLVEIEYYLPVKAQQKMVHLGLGYHETEDTGNKIVKIERGLNKLGSLLSDTLWELVPTLIQLVLTLIVVLVVDYRFAIILLIYAPLFIWLTIKLNSDIYPVRKERFKNYEMASGKMTQAIININAVQSFVQEEREIGEYKKIKQKIRDNEIWEWMRVANFSWGRGLVVDLGRMSILLFGIYLVFTKSLSLGTLVFVFTLAEKSFFSLFRLTRFYDRLAEGMVGVGRFMDLLNTEQDIVNKKNGLKAKNLSGDIEFKDVSFVYKNSKQAAISKVNFKIESGCMTALVGPSGGGKTTTARLIYRHYDAVSGQVLIDGHDVRDYDLYSLRDHMAIVPQEVEIFNISVRDNIAYANPKASMKEVEAAARIANAEEFILNLNEKYNTLVGERGIKLSGGQRQRIGIARAILANPKILIFDEATSNLDSHSEKLIQEAIDKISKDRTMIIIAHRLSTIMKADKIIVLENGAVAESGSHIELAKSSGGLYAELLKLQNLGEIK